MTGKEIRALRERLGMTQSEFAHAFRIGIATIGRWEETSMVRGGLADIVFRAIKAALDAGVDGKALGGELQLGFGALLHRRLLREISDARGL